MFKIELTCNQESCIVEADRFLKLVFMNLIAFCVENGEDVFLDVRIEPFRNDNRIEAQIMTLGVPPLSSDLLSSFLGDMNLKNTILGLDLFTMKLLMERYNGSIEYTPVDESRNLFTLVFPVKPNDEIESDFTVSFSTE